MIREDVMTWTALALLISLAFVLMPSYEGFKNAQGIEVDVDPNAPATPDWLKPTNPRTGKKEGFWNWFTNKEDFTDEDGNTVDVDPNAPPLPDWLKSIDERMGMPDGPQTVSTQGPSGVTTIPSIGNVPPSIRGPPAGNPFDILDSDKQIITNTLPAPDFSVEGGARAGDKYVLKSALQPCACATGGAGGIGGTGSFMPGGDDAIKKPFSAAFGSGENEPVGYTNSFSAFMK